MPLSHQLLERTPRGDGAMAVVNEMRGIPQDQHKGSVLFISLRDGYMLILDCSGFKLNIKKIVCWNTQQHRFIIIRNRFICVINFYFKTLFLLKKSFSR